VRPGRIEAIEALRGLAALAVAWFHLTNTYPDASWVRASGWYGWLGVEIFFVISGFIIPYSLHNSGYKLADLGPFLGRRMARLEPPYVLSIVLTIGLAYLSTLAPQFRGHPPDYQPLQVALHLLYLIPFTPYEWIQPVYWTLAFEFAFYISVGILFGLIGRVDQLFMWITIAAALALLAWFRVLPAVVLLFVMGFGLFRCTIATSVGGRLAEWSLIIAIAGLLGAIDKLMAFSGLLTTIAIYATRNRELPLQVRGALLWLGAISYSLYLIHVPVGGRVVNLGRRWVAEDDLSLFLLSLVALAISIAAGWLFHKAIEQPSIGLARRLSTRV
jgi:peptidoglycan/LPS O-acetylase OafA/YrhL